MKKAMIWVLLCLLLCGCGAEPEPTDYAAAIQGIWYAVEYREYVEFCGDGTVVDTFGNDVTRGDYLVDNETAQIWCNFGDDVFSLQITERDGKMILLDNNGTLVREADLDAAREAYEAQK